MRATKHITSLLLAIMMCLSFFQATSQASLADDATDPLGLGPLVEPPGSALIGSHSSAMLELAPAADVAAVKQALQQHGAAFLYETQFAYHGIAVSAEHLDTAQLQTIAGVKAVHLLPSKQRLRTRSSLRNALAAATETSALTGRGVRIGVIDSGVDYTHAQFGGPGTIAAFDSNNAALVEPGSFPTAKVVAGYDFAGDTYDADGLLGDPTPAPDSDPLDCKVPGTSVTLNRGGHGTHVAAVAAGYGVRAGQAYLGPFSFDLDLSTFDIKPGIAPEASLVALKVFGCRGSTTLLTPAIEYALDPNHDGNYQDRLVDVLVVSLGSSFGSNDDPDAIAINKAVEEGVVVVSAVGDNGNVFYSVSTPGAATKAITVGATDTQGPSPVVASFSSRGPARGTETTKPDLVAPGAAIQAAAAGSGASATVMDGTSASAAQVAGAAALVLQQHTAWTPQQVKAALVGTAQPLTSPDGVLYPVSLAGSGQLDLNALAKADLLASDANIQSGGGISFGAPYVSESWEREHGIRLFNNSDVSKNVLLSSTTGVTETGVTLQVPETPITLPPGASTVVSVTMAIDPDQLDSTPDAQTPLRQGIFDRYYMNEHSGLIEVKSAGSSAGGVRVRVAHAALFGPVSVYLDDQLIEDRVTPGKIRPWQAATAGHHVVKVYVVGKNPHHSVPLLQQDVDLRDGYDYVFAIVGTHTRQRLYIVERPRTSPGQDSALLVANAKTTPVDVYLDQHLLESDVPRFGISSWHTIMPGTHHIAFYNAGDDPAVATPLIEGTLNAQSGQVSLAGIIPRDFSLNSANDEAPSANPTVPAGIGASIDITKNRTHWLVIVSVSWPSEPPGPPTQPAQTIHVPYQVFPLSASDIQAAVTETTVGAGQHTLSLPLRNSGARDQAVSPRGSQTALVSAFELVGTSPRITTLADSMRSADLRYVGVTNSFSVTQSVDTAWLYFAMATYAPWSSPNELQMRVYLDTTGPAGVPDGVDDYVLFNTSFGTVTTQQQNDAFVSLLYRITTDGSLIWTGAIPTRFNALASPSTSPFLDVAPFNSTVMFQEVTASSIGLSNANTSFNYHIETRSRDLADYRQVVDRMPASGSLSYNIISTPLAPINDVRSTQNLQRRPLFIVDEIGVVAVSVNPATLAEVHQASVLLLYHHNQPPDQSEVVTVSSSTPLASP